MLARTSPRRLAQSIVAMGLIAVLLGLPLAVDYKTTLETIYRATSSAPRAEDALVASEVIVLAPALGVELQNARISTLGVFGVPHDQRMRHLVIDGGRIVVDLVAPKATTEVIQEGLAPRSVAARISAMDYDSILVRRGQIDFPTGLGRRLQVQNVIAEVTSSRRGHWTIEGSGEVNGRDIKFSGRWSPQIERSGVLQTPLSFQFESNLLSASFEGHLDTVDGPRLQGAGMVQARKLRAMARWFGLPVAVSGDLTGAHVAGTIEWSKSVLSFTSANVKLDGNEASGSLTLKTGGPRPVIEGTLAFRQFDLARYIKTVMGDPIASEAPSDRPSLKLQSLLAVVDADLRLSAGKVVAPLVETGRAAITIGLRQGKLRAELAELEIEGGHARGGIVIDATSDAPRLGLRGSLVDVDPGRIFSHHLKRTPVFGRADISLDVTGAGATLPVILAGMSGKGSFKLAQGGRLGLDLKTLVHSAQTTQIVGWSAAGKGMTQLDQFEGRFTLANGGVTLETMLARSGASAWIGGGKIDLAERLLDLAIVLQPPTATEAAATGRDSLAIRGSWSDPAISFLRVPGAPPVSIGAGPQPTATPAQPVRN